MVLRIFKRSYQDQTAKIRGISKGGIKSHYLLYMTTCCVFRGVAQSKELHEKLDEDSIKGKLIMNNCYGYKSI